MRVLKSWLLLVLVISVTAQAQDTSTQVEPTPDSVFQSKQSTGVRWQERSVPDSTLQRLRSDKAFWYANAALKKKENVQTNTPSFWQWLFGQRWLYHLLWAVMIGSFSVVLFIFLLKSNISLFQKKAVALPETGASENPETIFSIDYKRELEAAVHAGDFAAAIRLHYLQTLAGLSTKKVLQYKEEYPNSAYLQQLQQAPCYADFKKLTLHFEYAWYGKLPVSPQVYHAVAQEFLTFKQRMGL